MTTIGYTVQGITTNGKICYKGTVYTTLAQALDSIAKDGDWLRYEIVKDGTEIAYTTMAYTLLK